MNREENQLSVPELFRRTSRDVRDHPAIKQEDGVLTFADLDELSDRLAGALYRQGVRKGDRIGLYCLNGKEFAIVYLAILKSGAVVVPVNLLLNPKEVSYILRDAGISGFFYHAALSDKVEVFRRDMESAVFAVIIAAQDKEGADSDLAELTETKVEPPEISIDPAEDLASILYTSGTTGHPKGAMLTHHNLASNTSSVAEALRLRRKEDVMLVVLPMFHSFAATVGMLTPLLHGMSVAPVVRFDPGLVSRTIRTQSATVFLGVPSMYSLFLKIPEAELAEWKTVRFCVSGGASLPVAVMQAFESRFGIPIVEGDGPTECSPVTCVNPVDGTRKPGSVGLPVPKVEMRIMDERGQTLPTGETGEVCVRGPNVMKGYWNLRKATAETFFGEWLRTGDLGYCDEDGYFFLVDRKKDMIIVNGMNVYPRVIEEILYQYPGVAEAAVVGEPHESHGEIPVAYVVPIEGSDLSDQGLRAFCRDNLGGHEVPRKVVIRKSLPKNAAGKILKRELRKQGELERGIDSR